MNLPPHEDEPADSPLDDSAAAPSATGGRPSPSGIGGNGADAVDRRSFLGTATTVAMAGGLVASYGTFAGFAGRYVYPSKSDPGHWVFVAPVSEIVPGKSFEFKTPDGSSVTIIRGGRSEDKAGVQSDRRTGDTGDFIALSDVCPHLGCRVHWEAQNDRFFCPCHNGAFDPLGKAIAGPPAKAGQSLPRYDLKLDAGLLYLRVKANSLSGNG